MDTFENESINIYESIYESIDDILNKTFPDSTYKEDTSSADKGSNNSVTKYVVTSNDKTTTNNIVIRQSVESLLPEDIPEYLIHKFIDEENDNIDTKKRKRIDGDIDFDYIRRYIEDLIITNPDTYSFIDKDYSNWKNASDNKISPELFFYGFLIKKHPNSLYSVHTIIISEAYDMNLFYFYKKNEKHGEPEHIGYQNRIQNRELQETDINIANQLINLLTKLHNKLKLICFDIKPANFVIKINETGFDVKMIDLDMDWCHDYSKLLKQRGDNSPKELIKDISVMILANHFYYFLQWNIFQTYINENIEKIGSNKKALYTLFCNNIKTGLSKNLQFISEHYLYSEILERAGSDGVQLQPPNDCRTLFDVMFTDMHKLKPPPQRSISPRTFPTLFDRFMQIDELFPNAGGKSKKKKRISKKKKRGTRKTKSKNAKNNTKQKGGNANNNLLNAIEEENIENVIAALEEGADIENVDEMTGPPLILAINKNNIKIVELLLENGADIENVDYDYGFPPLIVAINKNNIKIVELLLKNGAKTENTNLYMGNPALIVATDKNIIEIVELLLENGADINCKAADKTGMTALMRASHYRKENMVRLLLEKGANVNLQSTDEYGKMTALMDASAHGDVDIVKLLLDNGADIEMKSKNDKTALEHGNNHKDVVELLKERKREIREIKKQKYLTREPAVLEKYIVNKEDNLFNELNGFETISMDPINYCEYIENDKNNLIFIYNGQYVTSNKNDIRDQFITNDNYIVFECKRVGIAFIPIEDNIIEKPYLNLHNIGIFGVMVPLSEIDYVLDNKYQIYIINHDIDDTRVRMPIASLNTRIVDPNDSGQAVVSANHCQAEVHIKKCNLSFIENEYLLNKCQSDNKTLFTFPPTEPLQNKPNKPKKPRIEGGLSKIKSKKTRKSKKNKRISKKKRRKTKRKNR